MKTNFDRQELMGKYNAFKTKYHTIDVFTQVLFLIAIGIYVFGFIAQTTMFSVYYGGTLSNFALMFLKYLAAARVLFSLERRKDLFFACGLGAVAFILYQFRPDRFLVFLGVMAFGCIGMDFKRILRVQVLVIAMTVAVSVVAALTGTIENLVYLKDDHIIRDSFGICYPTDFASYLFFAFLFFWIAWKKIPDWVSLLIGVPFMIIARWYAISDTCTICGLAFLLVLSIMPIIHKYLVMQGKLPALKKGMDFLLLFAYPIFALFMFFLIFLYAKEAQSGQAGIAFRINALITKRLALAYDAFRNHGITLWGSELKQQGNGSTTFKIMGYDFVDSSYPLMLLQKGVVVFTLISLLWVRLTYRALRAKEYRLAFGMGLITLHSFIEHHFPEAYYNILLFLSCALITGENKNVEVTEGKAEEKTEEKLTGAGKKIGICVASLIVLFLLNSPWILANLRSICGMMRIKESTGESAFVILSVFVIIGVIALLGTGLGKLWDAISNNSDRKKSIPFLASGAVLLVAGLLFVIVQTNQANSEAQKLWAKDAEALQAIDKNAEGKIYSTEFPVFYNKQLKKLKYGIVTGDDLGRKQNVTLIVPKGTEYYVLFNKGFRYTAISDTTAVYSNDKKALEGLRSIGLEPKDYCDELRYVEIPTNTAKLVNLRQGNYAVHYRMTITKGEETQTDAVELTIMGNKGYTILAKELIPISKVPEDGSFEYEIKLNLETDMPGIMFYILPRDGCKVDVKEVSYQAIAKE
ncbi:MAG: hypothetical protein J5546_08635 [Lachnospiraceae bacterium]|nr:hypothetical protein [Lachnospiraceae bacterium]